MLGELGARGERARRLRWRLRGAWLWPTFGLLTVLDAVLLHVLPIAGDGPTAWPSAFLLAGAVNVIVIAAGGGLLGWWLRRRRRDLPKVVADDYAGTALLVGVTLAFLGLGLLHRPTLADRQGDFRAQSAAVRRYVAAQAASEFRRRVDEADSVLLGPEYYRTCVPGDEPDRPLCLFVRTDDHPATVVRDHSREPNGRLVPRY